MSHFILGATACASLVAAMFFWNYWRRTHDRFFALFAAAFALMAANRLVLSMLPNESEQVVWVFGSRLIAFLIILFAIVDKNRAR
jgi:ABC-type polysaccharide/polyol phosphate export permease